jgi:hypothetical protein
VRDLRRTRWARVLRENIIHVPADGDHVTIQVAECSTGTNNVGQVGFQENSGLVVGQSGRRVGDHDLVMIREVLAACMHQHDVAFRYALQKADGEIRLPDMFFPRHSEYKAVFTPHQYSFAWMAG